MDELFPSDDPTAGSPKAKAQPLASLFPSDSPTGKPATGPSGEYKGVGWGRKEYDLPEFDIPAKMAGTHMWPTVKTAIGLLTTFDDKRQMKVVADNFPELKFSSDAYGNIIVDGSAYGGEAGYLNSPGLSVRDLTQAGFQMAAFTPAGAAGKGAGALAGMGKVGAASGATQGGMDLANQMAGGTDGVSLSNINKLDAAVATFGGAGFEGLSRVLAPILRKVTPGQKITGSVRDAIRAEVSRLGVKTEEITDEVIDSWARSAQRSTDDPASVAASGEFRIPYTRGQAMKDGPDRLRQMDTEDTLRHSALSPSASATMARFGQRQDEAISGAVDRTRSRLGPDADIDRPNQAGAAIREGVESRAAISDAAVGEAYDAVGDASLSVEGMSGLMAGLKRQATKGQFVRDRQLAPATAGALDDVGSMQKVMRSMESGIKPFHIRKVEDFRRKLNAYIGAASNPTDKRQVTMLKRQFDDYMNSAIDKALLSGDEGAMESLRRARGASADYFKQFSRKDGQTRTGRPVKDVAGDYMERIVSGSPTDEQITNWLFGASKLGNKTGSAQFARKLKDVLGPDSQEWQAVRQAAFLKLTDPGAANIVSGQKFVTRLNEATRGTGESFMKELFSPGEIATMRRLAVAIKRAQPDKQNASGTSYKAASILRDTLGRMAVMLGGAKAGPMGAVGAQAGVNATGTLAGLRHAMKAREAVTITPESIRLGAVGTPAVIAATE